MAAQSNGVAVPMLSLKPEQIESLSRSSLEGFSARLATHLRGRPEFAPFFERSEAGAVVYQLVCTAYEGGYRTQSDIARYLTLCLICHRDIGQTQAMNELRYTQGKPPAEALDHMEQAVDRLLQEH